MRLLVVSMLLVFGFPFIMTDVVGSFETCSQFFFNDQPPVISDILEDSLSQNQNRYRIICQKYKNIYRYATLYDRTNKIPIFSAYKYTGHQKGDRVQWMIEPQLEDLEVGMSKAFRYQANNGDYLKSEKYDRGHLFPCCHAADKATVASTCTLTNAVPQYKKFNQGSWKNMELTVGGIMNSHCRDEKKNILAYVLTGAVPNTKTPSDLLNNRVNIPSHMWTVFCCYNSKRKEWLSQAHWAENKDEDKKIDVKTLKELQDFLKMNFKESSLFKGDCLKSLEADASPPLEADGDDEPDAEEQSWWSTIKNLPAAFWAIVCN